MDPVKADVKAKFPNCEREEDQFLPYDGCEV